MSNTKTRIASNGHVQQSALLIGDSEQNSREPIRRALKGIGYDLAGVITTGRNKEKETVKSHIQSISPTMIVLAMDCDIPNGRDIFYFLEDIPGYKRNIMPLGKGRERLHHYVWQREILPA